MSGKKTSGGYKMIKSGLIERCTNLHPVKCHPTECRFEWLISPRNILVGTHVKTLEWV